MLWTFLLVLHVLVCIVIILMILLQSGKGADIGAVFGGGSSQTVFGSSGAGTFLSKVTIVAAVVFMSTSFALTYIAGRTSGPAESLMSGQSAPAIPGQPAPATDKPAGTTPATSETPAKSEAPAATPTSQPAPTEKPAPSSAPATPAKPGTKERPRNHPRTQDKHAQCFT